MLFVLELLLAVIIVAIMHLHKNRKKILIKAERIMLKSLAAILAFLMVITVLVQELIRYCLDKISGTEKKLELQDISE